MLKKILTVIVLIAFFQTLIFAQNAKDEARVESILKQMTLGEKIDAIGGVNGFDVLGLARLNLPLLVAADSPFGVRSGSRSNVMVGGIALAATWNPSLARETGTQIGRDARSRGVNYSLGPGVNIYRSPLNGRNFEYLGEDPFLGAKMVVPFIEGEQSQGVSSTVKHFIGNNSEYWRNTSDSVIDERAMREIYLPIFEAAVKDAKIGAVMSSYNITNGKYMSANGEIVNGILKGDWKFDGVYMSDWGAAHETLGTVNGGLDLEMPSGANMNREKIMPLMKEGKITEATIDDKVRRLLRTAIRFDWLDRPQEDSSIPKLNQQGRQVALQAARESMVLLKNQGNILPLDKTKTKTVAVIGPNGFNTPVLGGGSASIPQFQDVNYLNGISNFLGTDANVTYARGINSYSNLVNQATFSGDVKAEFFDNTELSGTPAKTENVSNMSFGKLVEGFNFGNSPEFEAVSAGEKSGSPSLFAPPKPMSARWTGDFTPKTGGDFDFFVQQAGFGESNYRLYVDGKLVRDRWAMSIAATESAVFTLDAKPHKIVLEFKAQGGLSQPFIRLGIVQKGNWVEPNAVELAKKADVVIVPVGFEATTETEHFDRTFALPPGQTELIQKIAAVNKNVIVVINSGGGVEMPPWIDKVSGVIQAWYAGQEGGTALAEILYGDTNPSGRLPISIEKRAADNPTFQNYYPQNGIHVEYKEGVFVGYRGYEKNNITPQFPFGFGLSYTTFDYKSLTVKALNDGRYEVSFDVKNTGKRDGADVPQIYVGSPQNSKVARPVKELKGFEKVFLKQGESKKVSVILDKRAFSYYDVNSKNWRADAGDYDILVGRSSAEIVLRGKANLKSDVTSER